ncbi:MAG: right-handed parallel beta-helix repeat-containing protein [Victivallales bacterium]|nr:right-handed parallel beta-helix repeat-containing protein [Victivallales bacterium]
MSLRHAVLTALLACTLAPAQIQRVWLSTRSTTLASLTVNWETAAPGESVVEFGPTKACAQRLIGRTGSRRHHVDIPLPAKGPLFYRVRTGPHRSEPVLGPRFDGDELRIAVVGDWSGIRPLPGLFADRPQMVLTAGDNVGRLWDGKQKGNRRNLAPYRKLIDAYPELFSRVVFLPVLGNHDREIFPRGPKRYPDKATYDVEATAFREFFELPEDEWKWQVAIPRFGVRFAALDLNHTSDFGTTWQTCHDFTAGSVQFNWFERLTRMAEEPFVIAVQNEQNVAMRGRAGGAWKPLFDRCDLVVTGFGYYAEYAETGNTSYYNTAINGGGAQYKDPKAKFIAGKDSYLLLTFRQNAPAMAALKGRDGKVLFQREHASRLRGRAKLPKAPSQPDFTVAVDGDDTATGAPDAPFRTVARARDAVRARHRNQPDLGRPVVIEIRGGNHWLAETLELTKADSGSASSPTIYRGAAGQQALLSGGRPINGWQVLPSGAWRAALPETAKGDWRFSQLWINGQRRYRPRLPKQSYARIASKAPSSPEAPEGRFNRFRFHNDEIKPEWVGSDAEILLPRRWWMSRFGLDSVDPVLHEATLTGAVWGGKSYTWTRPERNDRYLVVNAPGSLSDPGEWQLDRQQGWLTYIPLPGETPANTVAIAPRLARLVRFVCGDTLDSGVRYVRFENLSFAHTNWNLPAAGYSFPQAEVKLGGAITAEGAQDCAFLDSRFAHTGEYAIDWGFGCRNNRVENCEMTDLGAGGVLIGSKTGGHLPSPPANREGKEWVVSGITVRDCRIAHGGRLHMAAVGVGITHANYCLIDHNDVFDFTYTGITAGWNWGFSPSDSHHNIISYNHIHDIGRGLLSDLGGIYTLGVSPGTALIGNHIHDITRLKYGGWGIYHDSGSSHILSRDNVIHDTRDGSFMQGRGRDNHQINNVFANGEEAQLYLYNKDETAAAALERNLIVWQSGKLISGTWKDDNFRSNRNLYHCASQPPEFQGMALADWRKATGQDVDSVVADPKFADPDTTDFQLGPDSPAFALGFRPPNPALAGRRTKPEPARDTWPGPAWPQGKSDPQPRPFRASFEGLPNGSQPLLPDCYQDDETHAIRITDKLAAAGQNCLEFVDGPTPSSWNPHLVYTTNWRQGTLRCEFALRLQPNAALTHEWRTSMPPFVASGPTFTIKGDGTLALPGHDPLHIPRDAWVRFQVECDLMPGPDRTWSLKVMLPDNTVERFDKLALSAKFDRLGWLGFIANGTADVTFHLDDVSLGPVPKAK